MAYEDLDKVVAVSLHNHKQAALYFDRVLPCHAYDEVPDEIRFDYRLLSDTYVKIADEYYRPGYTDFGAFKYDLKLNNVDMNNPDAVWTLNDNVVAAQVALTRKNVKGVPIFNSIDSEYERLFLMGDYVEKIKSLIGESTALKLGNSEVLELTISEMGLVDTIDTSWEQILELKKDPDARRKLRNLRLFLYDNFQGKTKAYIADSIDRKLEEYELACRKHGLSLVTSSVSMLIDSKSMIGISTIIAAGVMSGQWSWVTAAAISGAAIETTKLVINVVQKELEFRWLKDSHELAYILKARDRLKHNS